MPIDYRVLFAYIAGIILLYIMGRIFFVPAKLVLKLIYNALIGGILLVVINFIGGFFGFHIAFNIVTSLIVGFLGIPGVILIILLKNIFIA